MLLFMKHPERFVAALALSIAVLFPSCVDSKTGKTPVETLPTKTPMADSLKEKHPIKGGGDPFSIDMIWFP